MTELACCWTPASHDPWNEPDPTVQSWQAAYDIGIHYVRMDYDRLNRRYFDPMYRAAQHGGQRVTFDYHVGPFDGPTATPELIESEAHDLAKQYSDAYSFSFDNEFGGNPLMSPDAKEPDISQGGTVDVIRDTYAPLLRAYMRGVRRALPDVFIDLADSDSTEIQRRIMEVVLDSEFKDDPRIRWTCHNYADIGGDPAKGIASNQDYSSMAGMPANGDPTVFKPGFLSVFESDPLRRSWYISEISKLTGPFGGVASVADMQRTYDYATMMLTTYPQCPIITIMQPKVFFTRIPSPSGIEPVSTWTTWTFGPKPVVSPEGAQLAALFAALGGPLKVADVGHRAAGRRG